MALVVVGLGSNVNREDNISASLDKLNEKFGELQISPVYESRPYQQSNSNSVSQEGFKNYYNLVVAFETDMSVITIRAFLKEIEERQDRLRNGNLITIDLDILLYGDWVGECEGCAIPHEDILQRAYVLRPLSDVLPEFKHPATNEMFCEAWLQFINKDQVCPVDYIWRGRLISQVAPAAFL